MRAAAKRKVRGVIVTSGTYAGSKNKWMDGLQRLGCENNITVQFVHIHADEHVHLRRVRGESRKLFTKTRNQAEIRADNKEHNYRIPYHKGDLSIDTTHLSARQTAKFIFDRLQ